MQTGVLPESGRAQWTASGLRIALSKSEGWRRQRFTLAHELGHHFIFGIAREGARTSSDEEETRCDKFAAALLMPEETFRISLRRHRNLSRLSALREFAEEFDVSLQAAMFRLDDLALVSADSILLICEVDANGDYRVQSGAYDRSAYARLERLSAKDLGIEDVLAPESFVRVQLPTKRGKSPHGSYGLRHAVVTSLPMGGDHRQVLLEVEMGPSSLRRRVPTRTAEVQKELFQVG